VGIPGHHVIQEDFEPLKIAGLLKGLSKS
jgi:hypothetical protein